MIAGACVLSGSLIRLRQLMAQLPSGQVRYRWHTMTGLVALFIVGYISYAVAFWAHHTTGSDLIVPAVFFFGAVFVWLTTTLSIQTAADVRRVTLLEQQSVTDPLIGIYNRRYLDRRLKAECTRARRHASPLSALLVDIDRFKPINDTYGHQVGDLVLSHLGTLVRQVVRESDVAARYGGDEVLIIAPNTTAPLAGVLAERLRRHVETHELLLTNISEEPREIRFTISIGVAGLSEEAGDCEGLVLIADQALLRAKQEGRNRIVVHGVEAPKAGSPST